MKKGGYSICLNEWLTDKNIKNELGLLIMINNLAGKEGYCWASNEYFAKMFDETEVNISRKIKHLQKNGYINITYDKKGSKIASRKLLPLTKMLTAINKNVNGTVNKNVKENNISIINNNNIIDNRFHSGEVIDFEKYYANNWR